MENFILILFLVPIIGFALMAIHHSKIAGDAMKSVKDNLKGK